MDTVDDLNVYRLRDATTSLTAPVGVAVERSAG